MIKLFADRKLKRIIRGSVILLILLPLFFVNVNRSHNWGGDFAQYINQAKCMVEGKNQTETGYIFNEQNPFLGPPSYPVGFPLLLAPVYYFFGNNIKAFLYLITLLMVALGMVYFKLCRKYFSFSFSFILLAALLYNPWLLGFKANVLADIPFTLLFLSSVLFYLNRLQKDGIQLVNAILMGLMVGFTILIKSIGFVLVLALFIDKFIGFFKQYKQEGRADIRIFYNPLIVFSVVILFYILVNYLIFPTKTESFLFFPALFDLKNLGEIISGSYRSYMRMIKELFSEDHLIGALTLTLFLLGFIRKLIVRADIIDYTFLLILAILMLFPAYQGYRYLIPVIPFILLYILYGLQSIRPGFKAKKEFLLLFLGIIVLLSYHSGIRKEFQPEKYPCQGPQAEYAQEAFNYIVDYTDENAVFAFLKPRVLALYTSRSATGIGMVEDVSEMDRKFSELGVEYLLTVEELESARLVNYISRYQGKLEEIWSNDRCVIYQRVK